MSQSILRNRPAFTLLALGTLARLPPAMIFIALLIKTQGISGSYSVAGIASGAYVAARSISAPGVGRLVDRIGQQSVLIVTAVIEAALLIACAALPAATPAIALITLAVAIGIARPPLSGCVRALLPAVVDQSQLRTAYAVESTAFELTFILGPPLALGLAALWSMSASIVICALTLASSTVLFALQPVSRSWKPVERSARARGAARSPGIRTFILALTMVGGVFGVVDVALPAAVRAVASTGAAGPVLGLWGLGSLLGGVIVARFFKGLLEGAKGLIVLLVLLGVFHAALAGATSSVLAMAAVVTLAGATIAPTYTNIYATVDRIAPKGAATEAFSWLESAVSGGTAAGAALAGVLTQHYGSGKTFLVAAAFAAVALLTVWLRLESINTEEAQSSDIAAGPQLVGATSVE